jgi:hypothetical protein
MEEGEHAVSVGLVGLRAGVEVRGHQTHESARSSKEPALRRRMPDGGRAPQG